MDEEGEKRARLNRWKKWERIVLIPILLLVVGGYFSLGRVEVVGDSMRPTLEPGDRLMVLKAYRIFSPLRVGDIVVIEPGRGKGREAQVIKRIVFIQDTKITLPWPQTLSTPAGSVPVERLFGPDRTARPVPPGGIIVLGDNLRNSTDSRDFGPVFSRDIYGKVLAR